MSIPGLGERLRYRSTGHIFEIRKITGQFVVLYALNQNIQVMIGKKILADAFEEVPTSNSSASRKASFTPDGAFSLASAVGVQG